jgi:putative membrane protein
MNQAVEDSMREERKANNRNEPDVWKGAAAGLIGGFVASWMMNQFQAAWSKATEGFEKPHGVPSMQPSEEQHPGQSSEQNQENQDDATVKAARAISEGIFGRELKEHEKKAAGAAVHYAFGTATAGFYGAVAEFEPEVTCGAGLPFGAAFWLVADETAVPLLGLSKPPTEYPVSTHAYALASHLVYGLTAELVRRAVRKAL